MPTPPRLYLSPPHVFGREAEYVAEVFASNWLAPIGPHLTEFERRFAERVGVAHAVAVASGTAALHLALRMLDLAPGDEVLVSTFTFCASVNPIVYERAAPVFIDADPATWNLDPALVAEELESAARRNRLPKAIVAVDIYGQGCDIDAIHAAANRYEIPVIEDAAEALGATYKNAPVGGRARLSAFSFNGNKIITTSGGGMLCGNDAALIERARHLATQARDPAPHYEHSQIGFNYRLSNVLAAIGLGQLETLDERVRRRREIYTTYRERLERLPGVSMMPEAAYGTMTGWLSNITIDPREFGADCEEVRQALEAENIESRRLWKPMHRQPVYQHCRAVGGAVADKLFATGLSLPSGSAMSDDDLERVATTLIACAHRETAPPCRESR